MLRYCSCTQRQDQYSRAQCVAWVKETLGDTPVPIISMSTESFVIRGNRNSFPISVMSMFDTSLDEVAETKQGLFNLMCDSDTEDSSIEIMVFVFAFC